MKTSRWLTEAHQFARHRPREAGMGCLVLLALAGVTVSLRPNRPETGWPTAVVTEGPFVENLVETGTIGAARLMIYTAPVGGGQAKIVELTPEGAAVEAGGVLIRFDSTVLRQTLAKDEAALRQVEAERQRAQEDLRLERLQADEEVAAARQQLGSAEADLQDALEGSGRVTVAEAETAAAEALRDVARTRTTLTDMKALLDEGFVTRAEVEREEHALGRAEEQHHLAALKLEALARYQRPAILTQSRAKVSASRQSVSRSGETAASRLAQRQAVITLARSRADEIRARVALLQDQIDRTVVRADAPGLVVYRELYFGADRRKPQVGDEVWPNQPLLALPDLSDLVVDTRVREVDLHKVSASQHVQVTVEAYPDLHRLPASVALVGALAQDDATRAGTKFFPVTLRLLASDPRLRTGMTARVEIEVASIPRAVLVPVQAIFERDGERYSVVLRRGRYEYRAVTILAENEMQAAVRVGLRPGEIVLLVDPAATSASTPQP